MKIIYVLGLSHSGSTLLDFLLSHHKKVVGLGESYSVLENKFSNAEETEKICSCGKNLSSCDLWSNYPQNQKKNDKQAAIASYKKIINLAFSIPGKEVVVDSSKKIWLLEELLKMQAAKELDLKIIFLVREARSWSTSYIEGGRRTNQWIKPPIFPLHRWYFENRKIKNFLDKNKIPYFQTSYSSICFETDETIGKILDFAGLPREEFYWDNNPDSHIAYGNRAKFDLMEHKKISYDSRWIHRYWLNLFFTLMPHIYLWNKKNVILLRYKK